MTKYINAVGKSMPTAIRLAQQKRQVGHPAWLRFYGYFSLKRSAWFKLKLWWQNGRVKI